MTMVHMVRSVCSQFYIILQTSKIAKFVVANIMNRLSRTVASYVYKGNCS